LVSLTIAGDFQGMPMQRVTITLDDELMADLDRIIAARGYQNRSEAIRDLARAGIREAAQEAGAEGDCVAALVYVYDHAARELSKRLVQNFHGHHQMSLATLHVHLDNDSCMEVTVLKGSVRDVQHLADHIIAERGVRHGRVVLIPSEPEDGSAHERMFHRHA
jgi:CopG family nickel-responsive transcriptional regulator